MHVISLINFEESFFDGFDRALSEWVSMLRSEINLLNLHPEANQTCH